MTDANPCEGFDHHDAAFVADPYPVYRQLREQCPVVHAEDYGGYWVLSRHADVMAALRDWRTFTSAVPGVTVIPPSQPRDYPQIPIELDPPLHTRYRSIVSPVFVRPRVEAMRPVLRDLAVELADAVAARETVDLVEEFAVPMSAATLGAFVGLPKEDQQKWVDWVRRMFESSVTDPDETVRATREFEAYIGELVEARRREPGDDFMSMLLRSEVDGHSLTDEELRGFGILMFMAGHETTASAMGVTLLYLAEHPEARRALIEEPELIPTAVDEFLRYTAPIQIFGRNTTREVELHGQTIPEGDVVALAYASANRDPEAFADPEACVLDRTPNKHLTFGFGHHVCTGAHVARVEMALMLSEFLPRIPDFRLAGPVTWKKRGDVRGLAALPVQIG